MTWQTAGALRLPPNAPYPKRRFMIFAGRRTLRGVALSAALATVLAVAVIIADFLNRYPKDLNVPPPMALLFHPAIGFVAEIALRVAPLYLGS